MIIVGVSQFQIQSHFSILKLVLFLNLFVSSDFSFVDEGHYFIHAVFFRPRIKECLTCAPLHL